MKKTIIGVMGPALDSTPDDLENAYQLGELIAQKGWVLLTGGYNQGVMEAASQGARQAQGLTVGILPGNDKTGLSEAVDIAIITQMGSARNNINVLSSDVVVACGLGLGTVSEIALALKSHKPVILLNHSPLSFEFFQSLGVSQLFAVSTPQEVIDLIPNLL